MSRIMRSAERNPHVLPDISARAAFGRNFYGELMRAASRQVLVEQALATPSLLGFMTTGRYIPQGLRTTLRYASEPTCRNLIAYARTH